MAYEYGLVHVTPLLLLSPSCRGPRVDDGIAARMDRVSARWRHRGKVVRSVLARKLLGTITRQRQDHSATVRDQAAVTTLC